MRFSCIHDFILFFFLFLFLLLFKYSCPHFPPTTPPPHASPPPTLEPTPLWLCPCVLYTCSLMALPLLSPIMPSYFPSCHCQFVLFHFMVFSYSPLKKETSSDNGTAPTALHDNYYPQPLWHLIVTLTIKTPAHIFKFGVTLPAK